MRINIRTSPILLALYIVPLIIAVGPEKGIGQDLEWDRPVANEDLSPLNDLAGYRLYIGSTPTNINIRIADNIAQPRYTILGSNLPNGIYYLAVTAFDTSNNESRLSEALQITISNSSGDSGGGVNGGGNSGNTGDSDSDSGDTPSPAGDTNFNPGDESSPTLPNETAPKEVRVALDFDGDGRSDIGRWREGVPAEYEILLSSSGATAHYEFGQSGELPAAADYNGDGLTDLASVSESSGQLEWKWRDTVSGEDASVLFGSKGDRILAGCHFDNDRIAEMVVLSETILRMRNGASGVETELPLPLNVNIRKYHCADIDGDNVHELLTLSRRSFRAPRAPSDKARRSRGTWYLSAINLTGTVLFERRVRKVRDILAIDIDGNGTEEPGISTNRRSLQLFNSENGRPTLLQVGRYSEFTLGNFQIGDLNLGPSILLRRGRKLRLFWYLANATEVVADALSGKRIIKTVNTSR